MTTFGMFLWYTYTIRIWKDGDGESFVFNIWHPFTWIAFPFCVLAAFMVGGFDTVQTEWKYNKIGLGLTKYWKENYLDIVYWKRL